MTPHYADPWLTVYHGDARAVMAEMEPESVHCVVTSPPYFGLRDYGTASWSGGDEACDHLAPVGGIGKSTLAAKSGGWAADKITPETERASQERQRTPYRHTCGKCGAVRQDSQLGLEPTPEAYVESMVAVFREVRRVLRADGTVWLNLGDSYASDIKGSGGGPAASTLTRHTPEGIERSQLRQRMTPKRIDHGLKPKDLVGIPWRVAFALQADGWYLRSDIIWSKPNPMPESVTDRPTKSHEYLFLLSKSARYYFDADAVREDAEHREWQGNRANAITAYPGSPNRYSDGPSGYPTNPAGRNIRSVWTVATAPYPGAHFATFPPKLIEPCIKAGTSERGVCPECGAPWERVVERSVEYTSGSGRAGNPPSGKNGADYEQATSGTYDVRMGPSVRSTTTAWRSTCNYDRCETARQSELRVPRLPHPPLVPATVLDPFAGSGTTGMVAQSLSRRAVLIDLSMDYLGQLMDRNRDIPLGLGA